MTEEVTIRRGTNVDFQRVEEILRSAYSNPTSPHSYIVDANLPFGLAGDAAWDLWGVACVRSGNFFVACLGDEVVGFEFYFKGGALSKILEKDWYSLGILAITPALQGKGIGMKLVTTTINHLKSLGAKFINVGTDLDNIPAISCYEKCGMRAIYSSGLYRFYTRKCEHPLLEPKFKVQPVKEEDYDEIKKIFLFSTQFDQLHIDAKIPRGKLEEMDDLNADQLIRSFIDRKSECLVSLKQGRVVGFAAFSLNQTLTKTYDMKYGDVDFFAVHPDYRGHGIGTDLLRSIIRSWIVPNQIEVTECSIPMNDWPAINVAQKCGFRLAHCSLILRSWY